MSGLELECSLGEDPCALDPVDPGLFVLGLVGPAEDSDVVDPFGMCSLVLE